MTAFLKSFLIIILFSRNIEDVFQLGKLIYEVKKLAVKKPNSTESMDGVARLRTDYIDLYQVHWPNWNVPMRECHTYESVHDSM